MYSQGQHQVCFMCYIYQRNHEVGWIASVRCAVTPHGHDLAGVLRLQMAGAGVKRLSEL